MNSKTTFSFFAVLALFLGLATGSRAQIDSVHYHDLSMETQWGSSTTNDQFGCFVRITPTSYPATLRGIRGYFRNAAAGSTFKWKVYVEQTGTGNGGGGIYYFSPTALANPAAGTTNQTASAYIDLTSSNIVIPSGDVYIGAVQTVGFAGFGMDSSSNTAPTRQWQWMTVFNQNYWNTLQSQTANFDLGFTGFFTAMTTGIDGSYAEEMINVFPNPATNVLHVQLPSVDNNPVIKLFDVMGKQVAEQKAIAIETTIDMSAFASGMYVVSVVSNAQVITRKVQKL